MSPRPRLALFVSGIFFGGGLDHAIFAAMNSPVSHYGFNVGLQGQLAFASFDFGVCGLLYALHIRWSRER